MKKVRLLIFVVAYNHEKFVESVINRNEQVDRPEKDWESDIGRTIVNKSLYKKQL